MASVLATGTQCAPGKYCLGGEAAPAVCAAAPGYSCPASTVAAAGTRCSGGSACAGGTAAPALCAPGTFAAAGSGVCSSCAAATYSQANGSSECTPCGAGNASDVGASLCSPCASGLTAATPGSPCTSCNAGFFSFPARGGTTCTPCPMRANCLPGNVCVKGSGPKDTYCSTCLRGIVINGASANFYNDNGKCTQCPDVPVLAMVAGLVAVLVMMALVQNGKLNPQSLKHIRMFSVHLQLISVYFSFDVHWPSWLVSWLGYLKYFAFDFLLYNPQCAIGGGYYAKLGGLMGSLAIVLVLILCGRAGALFLAQRAVMQGRDDAGKKHTQAAFSLSRLLMTVCMLSYLPIVRVTIESVDCVNQLDAQGVIQRVLQSDTSVRCSGSGVWGQVGCMLIFSIVGFALPIYAAVRIVVLEKYGQLYASEAGLMLQSVYESYRRVGKYGVLRDAAPVTEILSMFVRAAAVIVLVLQSDNKNAQAGVCLACTLLWLIIVGPWNAYRDAPLVIPKTPLNERFEISNFSNKVALLSTGAHIATLALALGLDDVADDAFAGIHLKSALVFVCVCLATGVALCMLLGIIDSMVSRKGGAGTAVAAQLKSPTDDVVAFCARRDFDEAHKIASGNILALMQQLWVDRQVVLQMRSRKKRAAGCPIDDQKPRLDALVERIANTEGRLRCPQYLEVFEAHWKTFEGPAAKSAKAFFSAWDEAVRRPRNFSAARAEDVTSCAVTARAIATDMGPHIFHLRDRLARGQFVDDARFVAEHLTRPLDVEVFGPPTAAQSALFVAHLRALAETAALVPRASMLTAFAMRLLPRLPLEVGAELATAFYTALCAIVEDINAAPDTIAPLLQGTSSSATEFQMPRRGSASPGRIWSPVLDYQSVCRSSAMDESGSSGPGLASPPAPNATPAGVLGGWQHVVAAVSESVSIDYGALQRVTWNDMQLTSTIGRPERGANRKAAVVLLMFPPTGLLGLHDLILGRSLHMGGRVMALAIGISILQAGTTVARKCDACAHPPIVMNVTVGSSAAAKVLCSATAYMCRFQTTGLYITAGVFLMLPFAWWITDLIYWKTFRHTPSKLRSMRIRLTLESYFLSLAWGPLGAHRANLYGYMPSAILYTLTLGGCGFMWLFDLATMPLLVVHALRASRKVQDVVLREEIHSARRHRDVFTGDHTSRCGRPLLSPGRRRIGCALQFCGLFGLHDLLVGRILHFIARATTLSLGIILLSQSWGVVREAPRRSLWEGYVRPTLGAWCVAVTVAWFVFDLLYHAAFSSRRGELRRRTRLLGESYFLALSGPFGLLGFHKLNLSGFKNFSPWYILTAGYVGIGWAYDLFDLPNLVDDALTQPVVPAAAEGRTGESEEEDEESGDDDEAGAVQGGAGGGDEGEGVSSESKEVLNSDGVAMQQVFDTTHALANRHYCGRFVGQDGYPKPCRTCDGHCGPQGGCQCIACDDHDITIRNAETDETGGESQAEESPRAPRRGLGRREKSKWATVAAAVALTRGHLRSPAAAADGTVGRRFSVENPLQRVCTRAPMSPRNHGGMARRHDSVAFHCHRRRHVMTRTAVQHRCRCLLTTRPACHHRRRHPATRATTAAAEGPRPCFRHVPWSQVRHRVSTLVKVRRATLCARTLVSRCNARLPW